MVPKEFFNNFCDYLEGKIKWSGKNKTKIEEITALVFKFFDEEFSQKEGLIKTAPYMLIDAVWRYPRPKYSDECIQIALEHEISKRRTEDFLKEEIQRLVDIKARYKIGIFYPASEVDEKTLISGIESKLKNSKYLSIPGEEYLFIFGRPTRQAGENVILFRAFHYSYDSSEYRNVKIESLPEKVIAQKK
jgi:hypothetical protein